MAKERSAAERAYTWLRERIVDGTLPGGTFVDEKMICEGAGVSRTPAREALNRLDGERFITLTPRRGAQVRDLNMGDLVDAYGARMMIESYAASEFCANRLEIPASMERNLDRMAQITDLSVLDDRMVYQEADQEFHGALVATLQNQTVLDFFNSLWRVNQWALIHRSTWLLSEAFLKVNQKQHEELYQALRAHDLDTLLTCLRAHLIRPGQERFQPPS